MTMATPRALSASSRHTCSICIQLPYSLARNIQLAKSVLDTKRWRQEVPLHLVQPVTLLPDRCCTSKQFCLLPFVFHQAGCARDAFENAAQHAKDRRSQKCPEDVADDQIGIDH